MQPGQTITPNSQPPQPEEPATPQAQLPPPPPPVSSQPLPEQPLQPPAPAFVAPQPIQEPSPLPSPESQPQLQPADAIPPEAGWQFSAGDEVYAEPPLDFSLTPAVSWSASEYAAHDKNAGWYMLVVLGALVVTVLVYLLTRDLISSGVMLILGVSFAAFGARKPQVLQYSVDRTGIHIGQKSYPYGMFRTFSILDEEASRSILLMPLQRFNLPISIYYAPDDEDQIIGVLGGHLPHEDRTLSLLDNLMRQIRF